MVTQSTALNLAKEYIREIKGLGVNIHKAFLFGSFAKNKQHEWSDIDVALIADDFIGITALDKNRFRTLHIIPKFMSIEAHTFPTKRLKESDPFIEEIKKTGIEIQDDI
jgi:predicted nucleotidyltransferase